MSSFSRVPGLIAQGAFGRKTFVRCKNRSSASLGAGDVVILHTATAAYWSDGLAIPITTVAGADSPLVLGVVAEDESTIPDGAECWVQVGGLHNTVKIDGTANITVGDGVSTFTTAKQGAKSLGTKTDRCKLGIFVDADWQTDTTVRASKVFLLNPQGLRPA